MAHLCVFVVSFKATHSGAFLALGMGQDALRYSQLLISELQFLQNTWFLVIFYQHEKNIFVF